MIEFLQAGAIIFVTFAVYLCATSDDEATMRRAKQNLYAAHRAEALRNGTPLPGASPIDD